MTKEQIADRIRDEFRKHGKNDPEGWPLIAAGKIRAEMVETATEGKYYYYTIWEKSASPNDTRGWTPRALVSKGTHPFAQMRAHYQNDGTRDGLGKFQTMQMVLVGWQEITKEEYELYKRMMP